MMRMELDWQEIDRELVGIAKRRAALDVEEARWLREAARIRIWREVGCGSLAEYMERRLGYAPHTAMERLRVALAIEQLPAIEAALGSGELAFSAVRELTRVATAETEHAWLDASDGKNVHEIEQLVSGRRRGDLPSDVVDPDLKPRVVRFEVLPEVDALIRQVRQMLANERGHHVEDNELVAAMCDALLGDSPSRARSQVAIRRCDACGAASQEGAGKEISIDNAAVDRAECDADRIELDGTVTHDILAATRRAIRRRDHGKCRVPGCRATRNLEIHHIVSREAGGTHDRDNLILLCNGHHDAHHRGTLTICGTASVLEIGSHAGPVAIAADAKLALVTMGFRPSEAKAAIAKAASHTGSCSDLDTFLRTCLRFTSA